MTELKFGGRSKSHAAKKWRCVSTVALMLQGWSPFRLEWRRRRPPSYLWLHRVLMSHCEDPEIQAAKFFTIAHKLGVCISDG